jgi:lysophospholipase L1-like esterase
MTTKRRHTDECRRARLLFICREDTELSVKLGEEEERTFSFVGGEEVRQIVIENANIASLEMKVISGGAGFTALGAEFDDVKGVAVDNLSVRSNNGQAMFWSNAAVNAQINTMRPYDLVVLQYGLNIMQADRTNYSLYGEQVEKMVQYVQSCFPTAAVLVMGVSDRSQKNESGIVPMTAAKDLSKWQRTAAENCQVAFWDTYAAMQQLGGMETFVANGWAGKDYTHINYAGGARIARELYYALLKGAEEYCASLRERIERTQPLLQKPLELDAVNKIEIAEIEVEDITESATDAADTEEEIL